MRLEALLLSFTLLHLAGAGFPEDSEPISISHGNCEYPAPAPPPCGHSSLYGRSRDETEKQTFLVV